MALSSARLSIVAVAFLALQWELAPAYAGGVGLATHRAVYDLTLDRSEQPAGVGDLTGRIVAEFTGSECGGYATSLRYVTERSDRNGKKWLFDARSATFEDGADFNFSNRVFINKTLSEESRGVASKTDDGVTVALTKPGEKKFVLDKSVAFPVEQTARIIEAGRRNENFVQIDVYDGTEDGELLYSTTSVISDGQSARDDLGDEIVARDAGVSGLSHWQVVVSYFNQETTGERTPIVVMSYVLYDNGIVRGLKFDYGNFAILGRLANLEILPVEACP
jgi:hypothetical protein